MTSYLQNKKNYQTEILHLAFIAVITHAKFHLSRLLVTLTFGTWAWRTTEKAGPYRVNSDLPYRVLLHFST